MYKLTAMIIENAFITPYKKAIMNKQYDKINCKVCKRRNDERHLLGFCYECQYDLIQRHDIVVDALYEEIINNRLFQEYEKERKFIKLPNGFIEKERLFCLL